MVTNFFFSYYFNVIFILFSFSFSSVSCLSVNRCFLSCFCSLNWWLWVFHSSGHFSPIVLDIWWVQVHDWGWCLIFVVIYRISISIIYKYLHWFCVFNLLFLFCVIVYHLIFWICPFLYILYFLLESLRLISHILWDTKV